MGGPSKLDASKVRVKGSMMLPLIKNMRAVRAMVLPALDPSLHHYLEGTRILQTNWYPAADLTGLLEAIGNTVLGGQYRMSGHVLAAAQIAGPYKAVVKEGDAARTLKSMGAVWSMNVDHGDLSVEVEGPGQGLIQIAAYPLITESHLGTIEGYLVHLLTASGARKVEVERTQTDPEAGLARWRATWQESPRSS